MFTEILEFLLSVIRLIKKRNLIYKVKKKSVKSGSVHQVNEYLLYIRRSALRYTLLNILNVFNILKNSVKQS